MAVKVSQSWINWDIRTESGRMSQKAQNKRKHTMTEKEYSFGKLNKLNAFVKILVRVDEDQN